MQRFLKLASKLTLSEWWLLFIAYWRLLYVELRLRFSGVQWCMSKVCLTDDITTGLKPTHIESTDKLNHARSLFEVIRLAARMQLFSNPACLPRSIVLADMLNARSRCESAVVKLGVGNGKAKDGLIASHAWVELGGKMVAEPAFVAEQFTRINGVLK